MRFFICFFVIVAISIPLIFVAVKRIFGNNFKDKIVLVPDKFNPIMGGIALLASVGIMVFEAICFFVGGFDEVFAYSFGWVAFSFGLIFIYAGFRHKIFVGNAIIIKPLLCPAKEIKWRDIELAKIRKGVVFGNKMPVEKIKIYSCGKKVLMLHEGYYNYDSFLEALTKNKVLIDDYKGKRFKEKKSNDH